jgi:hypothetical protein
MQFGPRQAPSLPSLRLLGEPLSSFGNFGFCAVEGGQQGLRRPNIINRPGPVPELLLSCE